MITRIFIYIIGLILTSLGLSLIIIYLSYNNIGYSFIERISLIFKTPSIYLFIIGTALSLYSILYDIIKKN